MRLSRREQLSLLDAELGCLTNHISNLDALRTHGGLPELAGAIAQLQDAMTRFHHEVDALRIARVQ